MYPARRQLFRVGYVNVLRGRVRGSARRTRE